MKYVEAVHEWADPEPVAAWNDAVVREANGRQSPSEQPAQDQGDRITFSASWRLGSTYARGE